MTQQPAAGDRPRPAIDAAVPHSARIWNYWLGGKDCYPIDQEVGEEFLTIFPGQVDIARHSRAFLARAVRYLAEEAGIRQFLDIGTGLPTVNNTHQVAQRAAPDSRIVYVDNDPLVLVHAEALLTSTPEGACAYVDGDVRDPDAVLAAAGRTLDLSRPVALMMLGILGHVPDEDEPERIVARLVRDLAPGSYVAVNDGTNVVRGPSSDRPEPDETARARAIRRYVEAGGTAYHLRSPERIGGFLDGLELVDPGVVPVSRWRPEAVPFGEPPEVDAFCGLARKP